MKRSPMCAVLLLAALAISLPARAVDVDSAVKAIREVRPVVVRDWRFKLGGEPGGEKVGLDDSSWKLVSPMHAWKRVGGRAWYRKTIVIPEDLGGYPVAGKKVNLRLGADDDGVLYINGEKKLAFHLSKCNYVLTQKARPGDKFEVALLVINGPDPGRLLSASLTTDDLKKAGTVTDDYTRAVEWALKDEGKTPAEQANCRAIAEKSLALVDLSAIKAGDHARFMASFPKAWEALKPLHEVSGKYGVDLIGHAHIDLAWLWRWTEAVDVCKNTFGTIDKLMDQYPDFKFSQSQPQTYVWMEERYPEIFKAIQKRVKEGRWEPIGAMWCEPDCNIPSGESFVRQLLYGKRYFMKNFGVDVKVGWGPDTFGFAWSLPQIYKKAGVDSFVTWRASTDKLLGLPRVFWWQSADGSKILTFLPDTYNGDVSLDLLKRPLSFSQEESGVTRVGHLFGVGDHGGGPTRAMLNEAEKIRKMDWAPTLRFTTAQAYMDYLRSTGTEYPVWNDELYSKLRGCLTPEAAVKAGNRRCEVLLGEAETFGALATLHGAGYNPWDYETLWRPVLMNQFHDILSGTGIASIYKDTMWDYAKAQAGGIKLLDSSLGTLGGKIDTAGNGKAITVYNALSWERTDVVRVELPTGTAEVRDAAGRVVQSLVLEESGKRELVFVAEKVPAVGYKLYRLIENPTTDRSVVLPATDEIGIENQFLHVRVDGKTGGIRSLFDKVNQREAFDGSGKANMLQTFNDIGSPWGLSTEIDKEVTTDLATADSVERIENGPVRQVIRIKKHNAKSTFVQDLILYEGLPRLDCKMHVSWNEKQVMLKVGFPMAESSDVATYEIPYGAIERSTRRDTELQRYKAEAPGQRWADISGKDYGVSILNDSKYGWDAIGNRLRLSLLRSTTHPDTHADVGEHDFAYSIYPHKGDWKAGGTVRRAAEFNTPLIAKIEPAHAGTLPKSYSFVSVGPENVSLGALKRAEDDGRWIIRVYEHSGLKGEAVISLPQPPKGVFETNLLEKNESAVKADGAILRVPIGAWEIKTLAVEF